MASPPSPAPAHAPLIPLIRTGGPPREMGVDIGRGARDQIRAAAALAKDELGGADPAAMLDHAGPFLAATEAAAPWLIAELRGMAEGSGVAFETLFLLNAGEELMQAAGRHGCTVAGVSGAGTADGHVLLAHNEDNTAGWADFTYVIHAEPDGAPAYAAFAYGGLMLHQGVNAAGLGSVGNALYARDARPGVPKLFAYRRILRETTLEGAIRAATGAERAFGNNHLLATAHDELADIEVTGTAWAMIPGNNRLLVHANHLEHPALAGMDDGDDLLNSRLRKLRVESLLERGFGGLTLDALRAAMSDHAGWPGAVCKHHAPESDLEYGTIGSVLIDVSDRRLLACAGNPCRGAWREVRL
ncbi:MAG: C45 family autoproteolytic acyltransferase/hydrolase [Chloroflexota bacterium]